MRIGIDYTAAINQSDGIGRFVKNITRALVQLDHENSYVLVHAAPNPGRATDLPRAQNVTSRELRFGERVMNVAWQRLHVPVPVDLATGPIDIFHAPNFVLPPLRNATSILTIHDLAFLMQPECADARLREYLEHAVPRSVARADYITTDSENTRNDVICLLDADPDRVFVVPCGVDSSFEPADDEAIADVSEHYQIDGPYILFLGVIEPRKNLPRLIDAFGRFKARTEAPHTLVIAGGNGWLCEETYRQAELSQYSSSIRFTGYVPDEPLRALYSGAELFVYPALYEGFGIPVLEAMACGVPVACANTGSLPEFAHDAALLFNPEDPDDIATAIETACSDPARRDELRRVGRERAAMYGWRDAAVKLLQVYGTAAKAA
ncbi:MAG: hypothetical protein QOF51_1317 [Chloroflexota bacterium]|jgi:glycosyltransferase involved in cell wall biosynthesis|nr:hypothetical protein [Chloroflexota bacterium]